MRRAVLVGMLMLLALPAYGSGQEIWVKFECVTNQAGESIPMYSVEGRPGAEFTVNNQPVGGVLNGGYGVEGENTWTATALPDYELTSISSGTVNLDCGGQFETAGGCYGRDKCQDTTTTTTISQETTSTESSSTTSTEPEASTTTSLAGTSTTTSLLASTTTALIESTTTTLVATSLTSQPPSSTDPTVAPATAELPYTGLSHNVWAGLTFVGFWLLTLGGMAVLAGRDDE